MLIYRYMFLNGFAKHVRSSSIVRRKRKKKKKFQIFRSVRRREDHVSFLMATCT